MRTLFRGTRNCQKRTGNGPANKDKLKPDLSNLKDWLRGLAATFTELLRFSPDARSSDDEPGNKPSGQKHVEAALDAFGPTAYDGPQARTFFAATRSNGGVIRSPGALPAGRLSACLGHCHSAASQRVTVLSSNSGTWCQALISCAARRTAFFAVGLAPRMVA